MASPVTLDESKAHLRVTHDVDDTLIQNYSDSASEFVETLSSRVFSDRAINVGSYAFPTGTCPIRLSYSPVQSIDSITYYDTDGAQQTMDLADVSLITNEAQLSWIALVPDAKWPATQSRLDAITISYTAGYGGDANVPMAAKQAILLCTAHYYDQRSTIVVGTSATQLEFTVTNLTPEYSAWHLP